MDTREINNKRYIFKIFDTASQERYNSIYSDIINLSDGILIVFDVTNNVTFKEANIFLRNIEENINREDKVIFLVGNKIDRSDREVKYEEAMNFAKENNIKYFETSAKTGYGINEVFNEIYKDIYELYQKNNKDLNINDKNEIDKKNENMEKQKKNIKKNTLIDKLFKNNKKENDNKVEQRKSINEISFELKKNKIKNNKKNEKQNITKNNLVDKILKINILNKSISY